MNIPEVHYRIIPEETYSGSCNYKYIVQRRKTVLGLISFWEQLYYDYHSFTDCEAWLKKFISRIKYYDKQGNLLPNVSKVETHEPVSKA